MEEETKKPQLSPESGGKKNHTRRTERRRDGRGEDYIVHGPRRRIAMIMVVVLTRLGKPRALFDGDVAVRLILLKLDRAFLGQEKTRVKPRRRLFPATPSREAQEVD